MSDKDGVKYILRTKESWLRDGKLCYGYADGIRDDYIEGRHAGTCIDSSHKVKWADEWNSYEEAEQYRLQDPYASEWEVVTLEQAEEDYYGRY
jgi:hypothetical protein